MSTSLATAGSPLTVVVGLGRSGIGAARLLRSQGRAVVVLESRNDEALATRAAALEAEGIPVLLGAPLAAATFAGLGEPPAAVVVSPGIRWDHAGLEELRSRGVAVHGR